MKRLMFVEAALRWLQFALHSMEDRVKSSHGADTTHMSDEADSKFACSEKIPSNLKKLHETEASASEAEVAQRLI